METISGVCVVLSLEGGSHRQQQSSKKLRKRERRGHEYRILVHRRTQLQARLAASKQETQHKCVCK